MVLEDNSDPEMWSLAFGNKEIFSGRKPVSHLDSSLSPIRQLSWLFLQGISGLESFHTSTATFFYSKSECFQWLTGPRGMTPHYLSYFINYYSLLPELPSKHTGPPAVPHMWQPCTYVKTSLLAVLVTSLPSGLCSNIISSERPSSATQYISHSI